MQTDLTYTSMTLKILSQIHIITTVAFVHSLYWCYVKGSTGVGVLCEFVLKVKLNFFARVSHMYVVSPAVHLPYNY